MKIIQKPEPPPNGKPAEAPPTSRPEVTTLPKPVPRPPVRAVAPPPPPVATAPKSVAQVTQEVIANHEAGMRGAPPEQEFDDGIRQRDPHTGAVMETELDQVNFELLTQGDPLRALYQGLVWAAESFKSLAKTTPAVAALSPGAEQALDQVAYWGYQVTNTGAELCRGLWNWPFTRVILNQQFDTLLHPEEKATFDRLYRNWFDEVIAPIELGQAKYDPERVKGWMGKHTDEIAKPGEFLKLCSERYTAEKIAAKHAWTPTDVLSRQMPLGERKTTTTGLESVFRRKPG